MSLSGQVGLGEWGLPCMACSAPPAATFLRAVGLMGLTCAVGRTPALQFGSGRQGELLGLSGWWPHSAPFSLKEPRGRRVTPPAGATRDRARVHSFLGILIQQYQPEPAAWQDLAWCSLGGELCFLVLGTPTWTLGSSLRLGLWVSGPQAGGHFQPRLGQAGAHMTQETELILAACRARASAVLVLTHFRPPLGCPASPAAREVGGCSVPEGLTIPG